ncbi:beta strand repeat-containing protein [Pelagibius sp.]|uniref:beta strand repeat-containing protein n=1 Tax=Pelagibius sp. TaxID=1931238 RepID=UPI003BB11457
MGSMDINERSESGSTNQHADNTAVEGATGISLLEGQAEAPLTVKQPAAGETLEVPGEAGAVYLLDFDPADARITVEGQNLVLTFDSDGDGSADSRIVFLELAGMADGSDAPVFQIAGVDYDIAGLVETALAFAQERGEDAGETGQSPAGPTLETAGGASQPALGGGATQYQDNTGSTDFSGGSDALSGVGGSLGDDVGPEVSSGTVLSGLPVVSGGRTEIVSTPESSDGGGGDTVEIITGEVVDGYIANATVFRDANGNGQLDDGEVSTITDINGNFTLEGGSGPLVAVGGTDVSTGLAFEGVLKAPAGATVITPLTTLVQQLVEDGDQTAEEAESAVKAAFDIADDFDLSNTDPIEAAAGGDTAALNVVKAGIQVANTATQVQAALEGAGATDTEAASDAAFQAIAEQVAEQGADTNLSDPDQIAGTNETVGILDKAANNVEDASFDGDDVANATSVITATNTAVENIEIDEDSDATEVLTDLAQVAQVAQEEAADAIENAVETGNDTQAGDVGNFGEDTFISGEAEDANVGSVTGSDTLTDGDDEFAADPDAESGISIDGLGGNDLLTGGNFSDAISGGAGNDTINGGGGNDVLLGGPGDDSINGGDGNDDIVGGPGSDTIDGGDGTDTVRYDADVGGFTFAGGDDGAILITETASGDTDSLTRVENIAFTNSNVLLVGEEQPFETIQDAIDAAEPGDTILVENGDYGPITIDKSLTLLAIGDDVTITGDGVNQGAAVRIENGVDNVTLGGPANGFEIETGDGDLAAVYVVGDNEGVVIEGNDLSGGTGHALLTGGQIDGLTVQDNELQANGPLAVAYNNGEASLGADKASSDVRFIDNTLTGGANAGLLLGVEADDAVITGNTFSGESDFANLEIFGANAVITGNDFQTAGLVPAIRDSNDNYDDADLIADNDFSGGGVPVLSPGTAIAINANELTGVTELDVSGLSAAAVTFTSLGELTQITTSSGQSLELDGSQIDGISEVDGTLSIVGGVAVNVVNADLVLPNDGSAPTVNNLLALEFEGLAATNSLIPENLTVNGNHASAFAAFWIPLDQNYVGANDYFDLDLNTAFAYLGNDYARYLNAGGEALLDLVKVTDDPRLQTLHDNLLGNLGDGPIESRFPDEDPRTPAGQAFGNRPYHAGYVDENGQYTDIPAASATIGWDLAHGITYPDDLPAPYGVLDDANTLNGDANDDYFFGGGGNDTIDGGDGDDTATYRGDRSDFEIVATEDGGFTLTDVNPADGDEGSDTLIDIENIQFGDGTLRFGATLARAVPEDGDGNDGFHPGSGNSDVNFTIHDNTEAKVEAAIKATARYHGDLDSEGNVYEATLGFSDRDVNGLHDENSDVGFWNFNYSVVDYGDGADVAGKYDIAITADFTDINGNTVEDVMVFNPLHPALEAYYTDDSGQTDGVQNSQNLTWAGTDDYNATVPGVYTVVLTVTDKVTGEVVAETEMKVEVSADIVVGNVEGDDYTTIQDAIDAAQDGDTIYVRAGNYDETVTINKLVKLYGAFGDVAADDSDRSGTGETTIQGAIILSDGADGTTIDGFTIADGATVQGQLAGIYLAAGATDVVIENNVFERSGGFDSFRGILTTSGGGNSGLTISQNSFTGWATGVFLNPGSTDAEVSGNVFDGNFVGMSVDGPDATLIAGNTFTNNGFEGLGIGPGEAQPALTLNGNTFADNGGAADGRSIGVYDDGITVTSDDAGTNAVFELQDNVPNIIVADFTLAGSADLSVIGNNADNDIVGNAGANRLEGGNGSDTIDGGDGDDTLLGGIGNDDLAGDAGADLINGGEGNDTLFGDAGADTLIGGAGGDTFVYEVLLDAGDVIDGFSSADGDRIDLDALLDSLGLTEDEVERATRVEIQQNASGEDATISIDSSGDATFDTVVATVTNVTGDLNNDSLILNVS